MSENLAPITADSILLSTRLLGLSLVSLAGHIMFKLADRVATPAGIAAMMRDPHLARGDFTRKEAAVVLGTEVIGGLSFGFDIPSVPTPKQASEEFKEFVRVGRQVARRAKEAIV